MLGVLTVFTHRFGGRPFFCNKSPGFGLSKRRTAVSSVAYLYYGVWLSLVERYVRDVEVASSNLVTPTTHLLGIQYFEYFLFSDLSLIRGKCGKSVALPRLISRLVAKERIAFTTRR